MVIKSIGPVTLSIINIALRFKWDEDKDKVIMIGILITLIVVKLLGTCIVRLTLYIPIVWPMSCTVMHAKIVQHYTKILYLVSPIIFVLLNVNCKLPM